MTIPPADPQASEHKHALLPPPAPLGGFAAEEFKLRRDALRAACPEGTIVIRGATEDEVVEGSAGVYRQNAWFFYFTGVETPGASLVLLPESLPAPAGLRGAEREVKEILFLPARDGSRELWTGPKLGPGEETQKLTGIAAAVAAPRLVPALALWARRNPIVYTIAPYGERATESRAYGLMRQVAEQAPVVQFRDCAMAAARLRVVKSPGEIERLTAAIAISVEGQRAARKAVAAGAGRREYEVEARVFEAFRSRGVPWPSHRSWAAAPTPPCCTTSRTQPRSRRATLSSLTSAPAWGITAATSPAPTPWAAGSVRASAKSTKQS